MKINFKFGNFKERSSAVRKPHLPGMGKLELPKYLLNLHKSFPGYEYRIAFLENYFYCDRDAELGIKVTNSPKHFKIAFYSFLMSV